VSDAYSQFLASKDHTFTGVGIPCTIEDVNPDLFEFQRHIVAWAVRKGCAAIWADTGLGKTRMQVEWARLLTEQGGRALILAPLAVAHQTIREASAIGVDVEYVRNAQEVTDSPSRIVICNYDRLDSLDPSAFTAVVLDESSILKAFTGVTKRALVESFKATPYRLSCSATPAPNDIEELCNHADFLGVMAPQEMRSTFFIADSRGQFMRYRLKGHAESAFYSWLASWAIACRTPSDLGFDDSGYILPPLHIDAHFVESGWTPEGELFTARLNGITGRSQVRKATLDERVAKAVELVESEADEQWLIWCGMNAESTALAQGIDGAVEVVGSDTSDVKAERLADFAEGRTRYLVTKTSIAGMGLNFQSCARMVFVGLSDSYEQYYQAIRRCYRFGQAREVHAHIVLADVEESIYLNVLDKEHTAKATSTGLIAAVASDNRAQLFKGTSKADNFEPTIPALIPSWLTGAAS
jgi:hypothetical protein